MEMITVFNKFFFVLKKVIFSALLIYTYDSLVASINHNIPINFVTVMIVSFFDMVGMLGLILFSFIF